MPDGRNASFPGYVISDFTVGGPFLLSWIFAETEWEIDLSACLSVCLSIIYLERTRGKEVGCRAVGWAWLLSNL